MLKIDYSLIPLSEEDQSIVDRIVSARLLRGDVPQIEKSQAGRIAVVNPDSVVQPEHQIPDHIRTRLRRVPIRAIEGSTVISAEQLIDRIVESEEVLFGVVIELFAEFSEFAPFVRLLPKILARYPRAQVTLFGPRANIVAHLQSLLNGGGKKLLLDYPDERETIEVSDPQRLDTAQTGTQDQSDPFLNAPHFQQVRVRMEGREEPVAFTQKTLRRLHPVFGYTPVYQTDVGRGRSEAVHIIDLPLDVIADFVVTNQQTNDFYGIVYGSQTILAQNFEKQKISSRWIPMKGVSAFLKRPKGGKSQAISLSEVRCLRINCQSGQITFVTKRQPGEITFDDISAIRVVDSESTGENDTGDGTDESQARAPSIGHVVDATGDESDITRLHQKIQGAFFGYWFRQEAEHNRKLDLYAGRLKVASIGPMAGQTVKLLRRFALDRFIDRNSFHYLCDTPNQILQYDQTEQRFQQHFEMLIEKLTNIAAIQPSQNIQLDDISSNLPTITDWLDSGAADFSAVTAESLDAAYVELKSLGQFISHEFQENFDVAGPAESGFFKKIDECVDAGLVAKWLADFKRGTYGPALPAGSNPDFIFFATPEDQTENDERYFFPGLAVSDLFADPDNQRLFAKLDFRFTVFLEEQLALADYYGREQASGPPPTEVILAYFDQQHTNTAADLKKLLADVIAIDNAGSEEYLQIQKQEEAAYQKRYEAFVADKLALIDRQQKATEIMVTNLRECLKGGELPPEPHPDWFKPEAAGGDSDVFDLDLLGVAENAAQTHSSKFEEAVAATHERIINGIKSLGRLVDTLNGAAKAHRQWQLGQHRRQMRGIAESRPANLEKRVAGLKRMDKAALENYIKRLNSQIETARTEHEQASAQLDQVNQQQTKYTSTIRTNIARVGKWFSRASASAGGGVTNAELNQLKMVVSKFSDITRATEAITGRVTATMQTMEKHLLHQQRVVKGLHNLQLERAHIEAMRNRSEPELPAFPITLDKSSGEDSTAAQQTYRQNIDAVTERWSGLGEIGPDMRELREARHRLEQYSNITERVATMRSASARKSRLRRSARSLAKRQAKMKAELRDLPQRIREKFMPARKELLLNIFIPEARRTLSSHREAKSLLQEMLNLSPERLQTIYLNRALYRRFISKQFTRGMYFPLDSASPVARALPNIQPAVSEFFRLLKFNTKLSHPEISESATLEYEKDSLDAVALRAWLEEQSTAEDGPEYDYAILPGTLPLKDAVNLIKHKDTLFRGVPRLVLIYIGKFKHADLQQDDELRSGYFRALSHNVIINIDGFELVDSPGAIGWRLLNETVGAAVDSEELTEAPRDTSELGE